MFRDDYKIGKKKDNLISTAKAACILFVILLTAGYVISMQILRYPLNTGDYDELYSILSQISNEQTDQYPAADPIILEKKSIIPIRICRSRRYRKQTISKPPGNIFMFYTITKYRL